jgi:glycosyltransferase involved in cell wall biosynthesis
VNVTLAPLRDTKFNKLKSELKVVEAGWMNKAIIASETIPYTDVIKHGENGFLVPYNKPKDWYKYIKQLILDPDLRKGLADNLTRDIKSRFNVAETAKKRAELYRQIGRKL